MRVVIAGASGFVGRQLVPLLESRVDELLLVGRSAEKLSQLFPNHKTISYENLSAEIDGFDVMLSLATMNNDQSGVVSEFREANVIKVIELAKTAAQGGVDTFIHFSTFHAVGIGKPGSIYAQTKLEAESLLSEVKGLNVINLRLPAVYGEILSGKLSLLGKLPISIRTKILGWIGAIQPVVSVRSIADFIVAQPESSKDPVYLSDHKDCRRLYYFLKRAFDLAGAFTILVLLGWLFPIIWIAIKIDSPGPGIFAQDRVGKDRRVFRCFKFRTMITGTTQAGTHDVPASSVTRVGAWLRATKADELLQIINVFNNSMSLVGPRPCLPQQKELIDCRERKQVFAVKPGVTGLAQVWKIDMSRPVLLAQLDSDYIHTRGLLMDMKILIATALGMGSGDRVVRNIETKKENL